MILLLMGAIFIGAASGHYQAMCDPLLIQNLACL